MTCNINIGILGHVDSGKTALARALSTTLSTAALDKHPESQRRGITIDLGFSAFTLQDQQVQCTLVDCPGHASLIKTVIGAAHIIDLVILVIDPIKGMQTQTAECLVIAEILAKTLIVVINKMDLIKDKQRLDKVVNHLRKALKATKFGYDVPLACVSAASSPPQVEQLIQLLNTIVPQVKQKREMKTEDEKFLFSIDHCFPIKGQGTVVTGTVLQGTVHVGDEVELSAQNAKRKIKSIQMFHKSVESVRLGDRAGMCLTQFDSESIERGWAFSPGLLSDFNIALAKIQKIRFFKSPIKSGSKFHITIGHSTITASILLFRPAASHEEKEIPQKFSHESEYEYVEELLEGDLDCFALLQFTQPLLAPQNCTFIASNLSVDVSTKSCRLGFWGTILLQKNVSDDTKDAFLANSFKIFKWKSKKGVIDRVVDERNLIGRDLFGKAPDFTPFIGLKVRLSSGDEGIIESGFGKAGKFKVTFRKPLQLEKSEDVKSSSKSLRVVGSNGEIHLRFKKYVFTEHSNRKVLIQ